MAARTLMAPPTGPALAPPQLHESRDVARRTIPSGLTTLAGAEPGQCVKVRAILAGVGDTTALLRAGDTLTCRGRTSDWLIVEHALGGEIAVHRHDAELVQIERGCMAYDDA
jgi:hypothetical protein